jgi:AraC-like DNA-binding protein
MIPMAEQTGDEANVFLDSLQGGQVASKMFDLLPNVSCWAKNKKGAFEYVNLCLLKHHGLESKDQILGLTDHDLYPPSSASGFRSDDLQVMQTEIPIENKSELVPNITGGVEWRETCKIPLYDKAGKVVGTAGMSRRLGITEGRPGPTQHREISAVVGAIYKCVDQEIKVVDLAKAANISVSTLERMFKEHMGITPKKFILQAKISTACEYLVRSKKSIKEIGEMIGYDDHANFTRAFKKLMEISPSQYRKAHQRSAGSR